MRFLKTLQKARTEAPSEVPASEVRDAEGRAGEQTEKNGAGAVQGTLPPFAAGPDFTIGRPREGSSEHENVQEAALRPSRLEDIGKHIRPVSQAVERRTLPDIQTFNLVPEAVNQRVVAIASPGSPYCEDYRALRTQLLNRGDDKPLRTITVVSYGPGEGKTVTSINLASMFAQTEGLTALLIDADMRRPHVTTYLGMDAPVGLAEVLNGKAPLESAIVRLNPTGLYLLPAGKELENVAEIATGPKFKEFLSRVAGLFDHVIIDAPPLGLFADGSAYMSHSDGALLVIRSDKVGYSDMERVLDTVPREKIIGAVLNESEEALTSKGYYEYSYYYGARDE